MSNLALYREAMQNASAGAWEYRRADDRAGPERWQFNSSPELAAVFGMQAGESMPGDSERWLERLEPEDVAAVRISLDECVNGHRTQFDVTFRIRDQQGKLRTLYAKGRAIRDADGVIRRCVGLTTDITELVNANQRTRLIADVFDSVVGGIVICDASHRITECNRMFSTLSGLSLSELSRLTIDELLFAEMGAEQVGEVWVRVATRGTWVGCVEVRCRDEIRLRLEVRLTSAGTENGARRYTALVLDTKTFVSQRHGNVQLSAADMQPVPSLSLQHRIDAAIKDAVGMRNGLAVFGIAIERFDVLAETLGHGRASELLELCRQRLAHSSDAVVICESTRGARFTVVIADLLEQRAIEWAFSRMLDVLEREVTIAGRSIRFAASAGVAVFPIDGVSAELLLQRAEGALEAALRRSRGSGHGRLEIYAPQLSDYAADRVHIEENLRKALKLGAFECHLQPKVRLEDGRWIGAEALIRWRIGDTWVSPSHFIPIAEESGLIKDLGRWVLWEAASRVAIWRREGLITEDFRIAVNLAGAQLEPGLMRTIRAVLGYTQLPSRVLMLELTETIIMENPQEVREVLDELRRFGVGVSLDDFGTGYTSMSQLQSLAVDEIKIDQSFVCGLPDDAGSQAIIRSLVTLSQGLGLELIAEGVESEAQRAALLKLGCRFGQGFLFAKALPFDQFEKGLTGNNSALSSAASSVDFGKRDVHGRGLLR